MIIYKQARTSIEKHRCLRETEGQFKTSIGGIFIKISRSMAERYD